MDVLLVTFHRNDLVNHTTQREVEANIIVLHESTNPFGENVRSLSKSNSRENSETTTETVRVLYSELTSQMTKKANEVKVDLTSQLLPAKNLAMAKKVLPQL